jgi:hypothetical protein
MPEPADQDDLPKILARAFVRAWERYQSDQAGTISEEIARPSLTRHLVAMAKEGVKDERALAAGGLMHLIWLTEEAPRSSASLPETQPVLEAPRFHVRMDGVRARFAVPWRIRPPLLTGVPPTGRYQA